MGQIKCNYEQIAAKTITAIDREVMIYNQWTNAFSCAIAEYRTKYLEEYPPNLASAFHEFTNKIILKPAKPGFAKVSNAKNFNILDLTLCFNADAFMEVEKLGIDLVTSIKKTYQEWYTIEHYLNDIELTKLKLTKNISDSSYLLTITDSDDNISFISTFNADGSLSNNPTLTCYEFSLVTSPELKLEAIASIPLFNHEQRFEPVTQLALKEHIDNCHQKTPNVEVKLFILEMFEQILKGEKVDLVDMAKLITNVPASVMAFCAENYSNTRVIAIENTKQWPESLRHLHQLLLNADTSENYNYVVDDLIAGVIGHLAQDEPKIEILLNLNKIKHDGSIFGNYLNDDAPKFLMLTGAWQNKMSEYEEKRACFDLSNTINHILDQEIYLSNSEDHEIESASYIPNSI
ncbi:hypothetical protein HNW13_017800 [Shewanella sp. BF02_Schw]|uniref:hypothetical protein n=1 Tax=Shewanella sp. BF02_Schw TaxID=394908 RepID=UPI00177D386A|nr:hypothetical protein [Shewanella sp. BF02_Schw]MBO1897594.1 hypothetical protein [Shewanella sp. BF02_Schw]